MRAIATENIDTWAHAMQFRDALDLVNALELLEARGEDVEAAHRVDQDLAIAAGIPAFLTSFMPKSAGTYLHGCLVRAGAVDYFNHTQSPVDFVQAHLVKSWLAGFLRGGTSCHSHFLPTPRNLRVLAEAGADKIWIHVRDPRQAALSAYWHDQGIGQGKGAIAAERSAGDQLALSRRRELARMKGEPPLHDQSFETEILARFDRVQDWVLDWVAAVSISPRTSFLFTTYEEMCFTRDEFEARVRQFFGAHRMVAPLFGSLGDSDRYRRGEAAEWREVYSEPLKAVIADKCDRNLFNRFNWAR